jgi:uncharacterized protein with von Willebrand factor type A (vWA) domain
VTEPALVSNLLLFARVLREAGLDVHTGRVLDAVSALDWVGIRRRDDVRVTLKSLLVHRHDDLARFDRAFDLFWRVHGEPTGGLPLFSLGERARVIATEVPAVPVTLENELSGGAPASAARLAVGAYSPAHVSRTKDFADFTPEEMFAAEAELARLGWELGVLRTRRWSAGSSGVVDLRRIVGRNMRHGGELVDVPLRERQEKARPIVVLADVSGSMERYSRMLLHFVWGLTRGARRVESFLFATRLTRVTRLIAERGTADALRKVSHSVQDWGGGTRIGEALRAFNIHWARRVMSNGPVVLIVSDGWDRGDAALLTREIARLRRSCRRLTWLNPLLGSADYEPLTRGMIAALPYVDDFRPVHNLVSLEQLAAHLRDRPTTRVGLGRTAAVRSEN